jgi:hypothetical protein
MIPGLENWSIRELNDLDRVDIHLDVQRVLVPKFSPAWTGVNPRLTGASRQGIAVQAAAYDMIDL